MKTTRPTKLNAIMNSKAMNNVVSNLEKSEEEILKAVETAEFQKRANIQMNKIVNRFLKYKREELELENYTDEEIEKIIETLLYPEEDEYGLLSGEDDDSVTPTKIRFKLNHPKIYKLLSKIIMENSQIINIGQRILMKI